MDSSAEFRRIDRFIVDASLRLWRCVVRFWNHAGVWWHYTFREPLAECDQANEALRELCGYQVQISTRTKLKFFLPGFRRFKFGVLVFFVPLQQRSRHWTLCWVRWLDDPLELYLVRSAAKGGSQSLIESSVVPRPARKCREPPQPSTSGFGFFDSVSSEELEGLLGN